MKPVNAIRTPSCIENFPQISAKPIAFQRNLLGKLLWNQPFFTNSFSAKLALKTPVKWAFFLLICPWKSREIWLFFRDLPEALLRDVVQGCARTQTTWSSSVLTMKPIVIKQGFLIYYFWQTRALPKFIESDPLVPNGLELQLFD